MVRLALVLGLAAVLNFIGAMSGPVTMKSPFTTCRASVVIALLCPTPLPPPAAPPALRLLNLSQSGEGPGGNAIPASRRSSPAPSYRRAERPLARSRAPALVQGHAGWLLRRMLASVALRTSTSVRVLDPSHPAPAGEGVEERLGVVPASAKHMEGSHTPLVTAHEPPPSIRQDRILKWFTASTTSGKRTDQSLPRRVMSPDADELCTRHKAIAVMLNLMN